MRTSQRILKEHAGHQIVEKLLEGPDHKTYQVTMRNPHSPRSFRTYEEADRFLMSLT